MDETTDVEGRYVINVIIGILELENSGHIFCCMPTFWKNQIIQQSPIFFYKSMFILWPLGIKYSDKQ